MGVSPSLPSEERFALLQNVFPELITYRPEDSAPYVDDPNYGFTMHKALGAEVKPTSIGGHDVVPMPLEQLMTIEPPDYDTMQPVQMLRASIRKTIREYGRAQNSSFSGLFMMALKLRGEDIFCDFYERPDAVKHWVSVFTETLSRHLRLLKDECGDIPYFVLGSCSNCMISPEIYEEFFRTEEARISRLSTYIKGRPRAMGIHHCGTRVDPYLDTYSKIPELEMLEANWESDIDLAISKMPGLQFKPMLHPIQFDDFGEAEVEGSVRQLVKNEAVEEIQAFDMSQFFTVEKMRRMLRVVVDYNCANGLPGYTRWFV